MTFLVLGRSKMKIYYHETVRGWSNLNINILYKAISGSYQNTTRTATKMLPENYQMIARW